MLLTAGLATYAGATVVAFGFGGSTLAALPYGIFYALFIFFIDRSVLLTTRPFRWVSGSTGQTVRIRRFFPGVGIRVFIAVCAALLVGETLLLRFFSSSIAPQVATVRQEELRSVLAHWDAGQVVEAQRLAGDLAAKQRGLRAAEDLVTAKTAEVNCQLTGGAACLSGRGPVYQIKLAELRAATAAVPGLRRLRDTAQSRLDASTASRDARRARYAAQQWSALGNANDLLIRERGFWRLTRADNAVKLWRILLCLLILGIDLAPLLFKRGLDGTDYARRERAALWQAESAEILDAEQVVRNTRAQRVRADDVAERVADRYEETVLGRSADRFASEADRDAADVTLRRAEIRMQRDRALRDLRRDLRLPPEPAGDRTGPRVDSALASTDGALASPDGLPPAPPSPPHQ
jgi:hypothetical protein